MTTDAFRMTFKCSKIHFPTCPDVEGVQDIVLKLINTTVPGTERIVVKGFGRGSLSVEFVPFGHVKPMSNGPTMHVKFVDEIVSCYVCYQESVIQYHYAEGSVHFCNTPRPDAASPLRMEPDTDAFYNAQYRAIVDLARDNVTVRVISRSGGNHYDMASFIAGGTALFRLIGMKSGTCTHWERVISQ